MFHSWFRGHWFNHGRVKHGSGAMLLSMSNLTPTPSVRNCCLSCSPKPVDLMEDQQFYNAGGPLDQQHFIVTKLQYKYSLHVSIVYHVFYKFILWRTTHFYFGPTVFLNYWSLDRARILLKVERCPPPLDCPENDNRKCIICCWLRIMRSYYDEYSFLSCYCIIQKSQIQILRFHIWVY